MKFLSLATAVALTSTLANAAQTPTLPACANICFLRAVGQSSCSGLTDYYCECTTGAKVIQQSAFQCLCANEGTADGCTASELEQVQEYSNSICSSALAASSQTYTPNTAPLSCPTGTAGKTSTGAATATASTTGTSTGTTAAASTSSTVQAATGAADTKMAMAGFQGAALGLAGILMAAL